MTSTDDSEVLIKIEDNPSVNGNIDNKHSQPHGTSTNYGSLDTSSVTRNQTSSQPAYRAGANPDGTHAVNMPDVTVYQQKKNLAQGMMDLALLSANANQLRYVLESCQNHPFFHVNLVLISISIAIQVVVGFGLIFKSQYNMNNQHDFQAANRISNYVSMGVFMITIINVMISAFNIAEITKK